MKGFTLDWFQKQLKQKISFWSRLHWYNKKNKGKFLNSDNRPDRPGIEPGISWTVGGRVTAIATADVSKQNQLKGVIVAL